MKTTTEIDGKKLYKVISEDGRSLHGGALSWSLPRDGEPGAWETVEGEIVLCARGLHLTTDPTKWLASGCRIFEVEAKELLVDRDGAPVFELGDAKCVARSVRLVRELTDDELVRFGVLRSGSHVVREGRFLAYGSASVNASGSAGVAAYDSARVTAYDSARVNAYDSASVTAYDSARVNAYDSASVNASGSAIIATPHRMRSTNGAIVQVSGLAVHVDHRGGGKPTIKVAE